MKISKIELSWFRGAAERVLLDTDLKSIVIYGDNATGKSSFADAFEFIIRSGRIEHLAHEYKDYEYKNCLRNTSAPNDATARAIFEFETGESVSLFIPTEAANTYESDPPEFLSHIQSWQVAQHLLRQNEVADFIEKSKSKKYSVLSPLLGLDYYEQIVSNISLIKSQVERESKIEYIKGVVAVLKSELEQYFLSLEDEFINSLITEQIIKYGIEALDDIFKSAYKVIEEIDKRMLNLSPEIRRYATLKGIFRIDIIVDIDAFLKTHREADEIRDVIIEYKINILEESEKYIHIIESEMIMCPACGREIAHDEFKEHIKSELDSLIVYREYKKMISNIKVRISKKINEMIALANSDEYFISWLDTPDGMSVKESFTFIENSSLRDDRQTWPLEHVIDARKYLQNLSDELAKEVEKEPKEAVELSSDKVFLLAAMKIPEYKRNLENIDKVNILINGIDRIHSSVRNQITEKTKSTLESITEDVRSVWRKLHPGEPIEDVSLVQSEKSDTAVDISLKFYGKELPSPRLTLSEGYRNSLGLSVFIALANHEDSKDHPIILDDIVSSLDRNHRGMIVDLLNDELAERQIILLTHDDNWYKRLQIRLDPSRWKFFRLLPWEGPEIGIRLVPTSYTFTEARDLLSTNLRAAGNAVRAIMDTTVPLYAQRLELSMPFIGGPKNDDRTNYEFLVKLISEGKSRYQIQNDSGEWECYEDAITCWDETNRLLSAWANPPSHGGTISPAEVTRLIDVCERALNYFKCPDPDCNTNLWRIKNGDRKLCRCGHIRWR